MKLTYEMTSDEIIKKANEWAALTWDESDLPDEEKENKSTNDLCKACGSLGWSRGYTQGRVDALKELGDRKVIQISFAAYQGCGLVALCDDGTLWYNDRPHDPSSTKWIQIPNVPIKLLGGEND